ncbi:NAD-dependent epimerase/dehydratase family protein [Streptomyces sp. t39]|uniref:NAD-dependent epimerase/dehydratase family protein n=1 Tax=Streptomyces sp. t39 TaxID=1828156 RepID=UPI0011CE6590|nr:NAD-dependent epimerase/dehydratase family protein [Streptomyces sp. t39]TXS51905.1 NAD-dependent epimerase/dehydratase family protein [Streptomyces sp. t39]
MTTTAQRHGAPERDPHRPLDVVVLGASGFVGSAVTAAFAGRPVRLRAVARRRSSVPLAPGVTADVRLADLTGAGELAAAVAGADVIVHLVMHSGGWRAAESDPAARAANVGVMEDLCEILRAERRDGPPPLVLYAGAASQVGLTPDRPIDGSEPDVPHTAYDEHKLAAERILMDATADGAVRGVSLRLPTVYGYVDAPHGADRGVVSFMVRRALAGEPLTLWHDGSVKRDLVHVEDVAQAFVAALGHGDALTGRHWLLGAGRGDPLGEVCRTVSGLVAARLGRPPVPVVSVEPPPTAPATDFSSVTIDSSAFRAVTGWQPVTGLRAGLERTVAALADTMTSE